MRLYKLQFKIISYYVFPFAFLRNWKESILVQWEYLKIKRYFKKLNWDYWQVQSMTMHCGSLPEAVETLCYQLTDNRALFPKLKKLIYKGYDTKWNKYHEYDRFNMDDESKGAQ